VSGAADGSTTADGTGSEDATRGLAARARRWLGYAGVVAVALGGVLVVADGIDAPDGSLAAIVLGFAAVVAALLLAADRQFGERDGAAPPDTEPGYRVPGPGDTYDPASGDASKRLAFKRRLSRRVVATLVEDHGCERADAERRVDEGTWTDDPAAAALLDEGDLDLPLSVRVRWRLRGVDPYERSARRALDACDRLRERAASARPTGDSAGGSPGVDSSERRPTAPYREGER
jgi:hypothetical protein